MTILPEHRLGKESDAAHTPPCASCAARACQALHQSAPEGAELLQPCQGSPGFDVGSSSRGARETWTGLDFWSIISQPHLHVHDSTARAGTVMPAAG